MGPLSAAVDAIETAYLRVDVGAAQWVREVALALSPLLDAGHGIMGWCYDASNLAELKLRDVAMIGVDDRLLPAIASATADRRNKFSIIRKHYLTPAGSLITSVGDDSEMLNAIWQDHVSALGVNDLLCLNGMNFGFQGCAFSAPLSERGSADTIRDALLSRIVAHLIAAYRIIGRITQADSGESEAVLTPSGSVAHAEGAAKSKAARDALSRAVQAAELARGKMRRVAPAEALELWKSMVDGRWTLTDQFEHDGKRFVVARVNQPARQLIGKLTQRESQVVAMASVGHSNKLIAYELGVSEGTIAALLARAQRRLRAHSIPDLLMKAHPSLRLGPIED